MQALPNDWAEEYWAWIGSALFLLITLDLLTSLFAAHQVGIQHEANPIMQWALEQHMGLVLMFNLLALALAILLFYGLYQTLDETSERWQPLYANCIEAFVAILVGLGLFLFANNLSVVVLGRSLVGA